jgi:hypothetical protein
MRNIWIDKATKEDGQACVDALVKTEENLLDPEVLLYPATTTLKATKDGKPVVFMPVQRVHMLESLGIVDGASETDVALALKELVQIVRFEAKSCGEGELYMFCREESTRKFAEHNGFELVNIPAYRMKL